MNDKGLQTTGVLQFLQLIFELPFQMLDMVVLRIKVPQLVEFCLEGP